MNYSKIELEKMLVHALERVVSPFPKTSALFKKQVVRVKVLLNYSEME